jgi:hypothetical protein
LVVLPDEAGIPFTPALPEPTAALPVASPVTLSHIVTAPVEDDDELGEDAMEAIMILLDQMEYV